MKLIINTDGASRGNPGESSYGYVIRDDSGRVLHEEGKYIGINTNNYAEYTAVLKALEYIESNLDKNSYSQIEVVADSLLVVSQLSGRYKIKNAVLKTLFDQIKILEMELGVVTFRHVFREFNKAADRLANLALDNRQK